MEADELWTYISKKKLLAGPDSGGLVGCGSCYPTHPVPGSGFRVPGSGGGAGRWGIVAPSRPSAPESGCAASSRRDRGHIPFATDFWHPYGIIFAQHRHVQGQAHTFTIESCNHRLRVYLARLRRKTHCYRKSLANLAASILLYLIRKCGAETISILI